MLMLTNYVWEKTKEFEIEFLKKVCYFKKSIQIESFCYFLGFLMQGTVYLDRQTDVENLIFVLLYFHFVSPCVSQCVNNVIDNRFLGFPQYYPQWLPWKRENHQWRVLCLIIGSIQWWPEGKMAAFGLEKSSFL